VYCAQSMPAGRFVSVGLRENTQAGAVTTLKAP
jgi:hypothetical protein